MWKYELEYRIDKPETEGETDKRFDLDNYKDWLEEQLTNCRKQLSIQGVVVSLICDHPKDEVEDYHDCTKLCNKCGCIIEQYGKEINPPSPL